MRYSYSALDMFNVSQPVLTNICLVLLKVFNTTGQNPLLINTSIPPTLSKTFIFSIAIGLFKMFLRWILHIFTAQIQSQ